jgi:hypothetical protein
VGCDDTATSPFARCLSRQVLIALAGDIILLPPAQRQDIIRRMTQGASPNVTIAGETIWGQRPGEDAFEITIEIGTPCQVGDDPEEWACPVALTPLYKGLQDAHGGSSFQALCLASSLVLDLLSGFKEKGGVLFHSPGEEFPLEAYAFGVAARRVDAFPKPDDRSQP